MRAHGTPDPTRCGATQADAAASRSLAVASHMRLCPIDDQVIVLDLLNNRYAGIAGALSEALASVSGWSPDGQPAPSTTRPAGAANALELMRTRGWLVETGARLPSIPTDAELPEATQTLLPRAHAGRPLIAFVRAGHVLGSAISAAWRLRRRSLFAIAAGVAERRRRLHEHRVEPAEAELVDAVSAYLRLRPLFFSARERCLHDSLTLVTFLAAHGIPARWVIGVRIRPFAAHSWVQHGGLVLNDQHERVRAYRPILVV